MKQPVAFHYTPVWQESKVASSANVEVVHYSQDGGNFVYPENLSVTKNVNNRHVI